MSLEDNIYWLTQAVKAQGEASAVAEIIRQRDKAIKETGELAQRVKWEESSRNDYRERYWKEQRRTAALRGVITRMKNKRKEAP